MSGKMIIPYLKKTHTLFTYKMNEEKSLYIVLDSLVGRLEDHGFIDGIDAEVNALFIKFWDQYDLVKYQRRYYSLPNEYFKKLIPLSTNQKLAMEYALYGLANAERDHYKTSK